MNRSFGSTGAKRRANARLGRAIVIGLIAPGLCLARPPRVQAQEDSLEYAVKAAYLVKMAPFVEWPANAFASATAPLPICVLGADPFGELLDRAAQGQKEGDHAIEVRRIQRPDPACRIVYWQDGDGGALADVFASKPVLTVTDNAARPGIVNFVLQAGHVRFEINEEAARASRLVISSKLLSLAVRVRGGTP